MPILNTSDVTKNADTNTPDQKLYTNPVMKTSTLLNKDRKLDTIINTIDGMRWSVQFFTQTFQRNTEAMLPDINKPASEISYDRINNLDLYLQQSIEQNDPNDITGTAIINAGFMPKFGDAFIAELTGGRQALFVINEPPTKEMYTMHDTYSVTFKLHMFLDIDTAMYNDLVLKTVKKYSYDKTFIESKSSPIILEEDYVKKLNYHNVKKDLINYYFNKFINHKQYVLALPTIENSNEIYIDTMLTDFIFKIIGYTDHPFASKINRHSMPNVITEYSIYDLVINKDISKLPFLNKNMDFASLPMATAYPSARTISWATVTAAVNDLTKFSRYDVKSDTVVNTVENPSGYISPIAKNLPTDPTDLTTVPINYIFSDSFYNNISKDSGLLERCLLQFIKDEVININDFDKLIEQYRYWTTIEQFYLIPFLMLMIQDKINTMYSAI